MAASSDLSSLFARLASNFPRAEEEPSLIDKDDGGDLSDTVDNLNRSLNLIETHPRSRILDTALSFMCFTAPQVYEVSIEATVKTIASVLSSSIQCNVLKVGKEEALRVGTSISSQDCIEVVQACADILEKLHHHTDLSPALLYAVVRAAVMASRFEYGLKINTGITDIKYSSGCTYSFARLLDQIPQKLSAKGEEMPLRLMLWYSDSAILKHDVSEILQEAIRRPLLYLTMEFYQRTEWRSLVISLAVAPAIFVETRALLHNWFLLTGLGSVLKLQNELVAVLLDIISRPMSWGLSEEIGSKLPFSLAYFPYPHQLLRTFAGPLSWDSFLYLSHKISRLSYDEHYDTTSTVKIKLVDHQSLWASAMNFPVWFYLAALLLFSTENIRDRFCLKCAVSAVTDQWIREGLPYSAAATQFVAWLLCPTSKSNQDVLVDNLSTISASWTKKNFGSKKNEVSSDYKEKGKPSLHRQDAKCHTLLSWLGEFHDMCGTYIKLVGFSSSCEVQPSQGGLGSQQHCLLFRKILIGILIGYHDFIDEADYEILLHYTATGTVLLLPGTQPRRLKHRREKHKREETSLKCDERFTKADAVAGAAVVFELTDSSENMGESLFETEEMSQKFLYAVKLKAGKYLHKCVERLIQHEEDRHDDDSLEMLKDLHNGMCRWRVQGPDTLQDLKDLNHVFQKLKAVC